MARAIALPGICTSGLTINPSRRDYRRPEAIVEAAVMQLYTAIGATVNKSSAAVHAKGVTSGIPDLYMQHEAWGLEWFHEVKPQGRRQSAVQLAFAARCVRINRTPYVLGGLDAAWGFLRWLGIAKWNRNRESVLIQPRSRWTAHVDETMHAGGLEGWPFCRAAVEMQEVYGYQPPARRR